MGKACLIITNIVGAVAIALSSFLTGFWVSENPDAACNITSGIVDQGYCRESLSNLSQNLNNYMG